MRRRFILLIFVTIGLSLIFLADRTYRGQIRQENDQALAQASAAVENRLQASVNTRLLAVADLQAFMLAGPALPSSAVFDQYAAAALENYPAIRAFQYVDPDRIIRYIYPLAGNEAALGLDISTQWSAPFIEKAIAERRTTVSDPTETIQGSFSIIARAPLYREGELLGVVQVVFDVGEIGEEALAGTDGRFDVRLDDGQNQFFWGKEIISNQPQTIVLPVGDNRWQLTVGWAENAPTPSPFILAMIWGGGSALLFSLLLILHRVMVESESRFRELAVRNQQILETTLEGYILADGVGQIVEVNPAYCDMVGYTRDELCQMNINDLEAQLDPAQVEARIREMMAAGSFRFETQHRHKNGRILDLDVSIAIMDDQGEPLVAAFVHDVTERRQVEAAVKASENNYRTLFEEASDAILVLDEESNVLDANKQASKLLGVAHNELMASNALTFMHEEDVAGKDHAAALALLLDGKTVHSDYRLRRPDGSYVPVELSTKMLDENRFLNIARDLTERVAAEKALAEALAKWESLAQNAPNYIAILDQDYRLQYVNHVQPGFQLEEIIGTSTLAYTAPEYHDMVRQKIDHVFQTGEAAQYEIQGEGPQGETAWYETWVGPLVMNGAITFVTLISSEITERKRAEGALKQYTRRLETLRRIDGAILSAQSKEEIAQAALVHIHELISCQRAAVGEFDFASKSVKILATNHAEGIDVKTSGQNFVLTEEFVTQISQGSPIVIDDLAQFGSHVEVAALYAGGLRTYLVIPLIVQGELIGGLTFGANEPGVFSEADVTNVQQVANHLAVALQQARLNTLVQNRLQELIALQQASLAFARLSSPSEIGREVIRVIETELQYRRGAIFLLTESGTSLELLAHSSAGLEGSAAQSEFARVQSLVTGVKGISGWVALHGETVRSGDVRQDPRYVAADPCIRSELCVPLQVGGKTIGALNVESEAPDAFDEHDERLLLTLANQTAVALENARLFDAEIEQRGLAEALRDTVVAINKAQVLDEVLDAIMNNLARAVEHDARDVMLIYDGAAHTVRVGGDIDVDYEAWQQAVVLPLETTADLQEMMKTRRPHYIPDVHQFESWVPIAETRWIRSCITAPIFVGETAVGFISVYSQEPNRFSDDDALRLEGFAEQAAVGIEKAQLITSLEQRVAERTRSLEQQYNRQAALAAIELAISEPSELQGALKRIAQLVHEYLPASQGASVILWDAALERFTISAATVPGQDEQHASKRVRHKTGATRWIVDNQKPLIVTDTQNDPFGANRMLDEFSLHAYAGVPILDGQRSLGVLYALESKPREFTRDDLDFMQIIAARAAVAIIKVGLYEELKVANALLVNRSEELEARNKELETFTYSVSHDLKAPLRGIDGYGRLLLEDYGEQLDEDGRLFLNNVRKATLQMNELIEDLLLYSRLERRTLLTGPVNLPDLVNVLLTERAEDVAAQGVAVELNVPETAVSADQEGLALALRNLLDNALKFTRDATQPVIEIGGRETEKSCIIWVRDNGLGFEMKFHDRIFEIFQRLHRAEDYPGTGIGLAIVQKAIERMNGRAWAESEPGQGATFYLEIPRCSP